ncbi:hypothetical protein IQ268_03950 [Oculatella sp. LEGE 06141]|nr:hypothetical protein [Oculatella sp. LEGE 06141]
MVIGRQPLFAKAGFVLPTTVLLLLVVTLTVGSIGYRTYTRSQQTMGERQQRVIYNAATPAIDRAKAKLEYLFDVQKDPRFPGGIPSEDWLMGMLLNDGKPVNGITVGQHRPQNYDPYTFPDEGTRIDINGDGRTDNAWKYKADTDGDGVDDALVAYSIVFQTPAAANAMKDSRPAALQGRAKNLQVRQAPLSNLSELNNSCKLDSSNSQSAPPIEQGWFRDDSNTAILRKNFQVNAYVLPINADGSPNLNGTVSTLEFQQDRQLTRGNKWGAWFRNDLEIFPGPAFNWNGAMHTEGNLVVGGSQFVGYLISSPASCLYTKDASEITIAANAADPAKDQPAFTGQFMSGTVRDDKFDGNSTFHLYTSTGPSYKDGGGNPISKLDTGTDSVKPTSGTTPAAFSLDPVRLQTENISAARKITNFEQQMDGNWEKGELSKQERMRRQAEKAPYVDDTYRADNRYGPKPTYADEAIPGAIGLPISGEPKLIGNDPGPGQDTTSVGLDGYWERRARREGLRVIVGQRMELGDQAGWGGPQDATYENEPLLPFQGCTATNNNRCAESRQRETLWDNLSAVQAAAIYHKDSPSGVDIPAACLALTVHPGTAKTLEESATFRNLALGLPASTFQNVKDENGNPAPIISNFFRGQGTNGWEYSVPKKDDFKSGTPLMRALKNLALYAGDPAGGAPSFQPQQDSNGGDVHPYPKMAMWGDFSMLRNVIRLIDNGATFDTLSPADKSTLYSASCTLGMLAYNVNYLEQLDIQNLPGNLIGPPGQGDGAINNGLRGALRSLLKGTAAVPPLTVPDPELLLYKAKINPNNATDNGAWVNATGSNNPDVFVWMLERWGTKLSGANKTTMDSITALARLVIDKQQVERDRHYGFSKNQQSLTCDLWEKLASAEIKKKVPPIPDNWYNQRLEEPLLLLCSKRARYPILHSIFTTYDPTLDGNITNEPKKRIDLDYSKLDSHDESSGVPLQRTRDFFDAYIDKVNVQANPRAIYTVVRPSDIALSPRYLTDWNLPAVDKTNAALLPNSNRENLIKCTPNCPDSASGAAGSAKVLSVALKDGAFFNGREMMSVRTLDMDLKLMRSPSSKLNNKPWLPPSGIVYAFREDAVSENNIVRPRTSGATWSKCKKNDDLQTATCRMNVSATATDAFNSTDPPYNETNRISTKPVDYFADPDRRPNGFRIRRGMFVWRDGDDGRGLSFVSDNPVYIQGDFNLHQRFSSNGQETRDDANRLEEFNTKLADNYTADNFYNRKDLNTTEFSQKEKDQWRPSEILADGITILSDNFCDGSIEDGFMTLGQAGSTSLKVSNKFYGCMENNAVPTQIATSYLNQNRPSVVTAANTNGVYWMRTNIAELDRPVLAAETSETSPIVITNSGDPMRHTGDGYDKAYYAVNSVKARNVAKDLTRVNSILISGIVPSRPKQSYGGLHNFPRFIEDWSGKKLYISGSFIQLNFSNYATAPFDQDSFETNQTTVDAEVIRYYEPPNRLWGYDVGLQYAPAGPIAQRFVTSQAIRSEFYNEPPANDPFIRNLCLQVNTVCPPLATGS